MLEYSTLLNWDSTVDGVDIGKRKNEIEAAQNDFYRRQMIAMRWKCNG